VDRPGNPSFPRAGLLALGSALAVLCAGALGASPAGAETLAATCTTLPSKISEAATSGEADTIVLTGLCEGSQARVVLPEHISLTLEGAPGTNSGLDGSAIHERLLEGTGLAGAITIANLTIEQASGGGGLYLFATSVALSHDLIAGNTEESTAGYGGGAYIGIAPQNGDACEPGEPAGLTVTDTSFIGDTAKGSSGPNHGGGLYGLFECPGRPESLTGDVFEHDSVDVSGSGEADGGGASFISNLPHDPGILRQVGDQFESDTVSGPAEGNRGGGGEWLEGINLTSIGDRFSRDSITGTSGAAWSWGGGLGILNTSCSLGAPDESTLEDAVVAGNSIGAGTPADLGGAGIYVGIACAPEPGYASHLSLLDSTVTENAVDSAGGTSGIDGHPGDQLAIENSIVASNPNGSQIEGFNGTGGSLTSTFSDVCDEAATAPLPGEGNMCAAPKLTDEGNPSSFDVHETEASPTIDRGSNGLVPSGLATDFYGNPRIAASFKDIGCPFNEEPGVGPARVDMGAAEYVGTAIRGPAPPCAPPEPLRSSFTFPKLTQLTKGAVKLAFTGLGTGKLAVTARFTLTRFVTVRVHGRRARRRRSETITLAHSVLTLAEAGNRILVLTPSKHAQALLAAHRHEQLELTITYTATGDLPTTKSRTFSDVYRLAGRRRHHG
jgi:hypothetical protein